MSTADEVKVLPEVTMTDELAAAIQAATSTADVRALLMAEAEKQQVAATQLATDQATAEKAAADKIAADQAAAVIPQTVTRNVNIGGRTFTFEGADEAEVDRLELNALKVAYAVHEDTPARGENTPDAAAVAANAEAEVAAKAELERQFRLGEISAADYIQKSGAIKSYLEAEGVSIDALKDTVNAKQGAQFAQSWAEAGEMFRNSPAGLDWPGGDRNKELIGLKIAAMGLVDAEDKVAALAQAYAELKRTNTLFPGDEPVHQPTTITAADLEAAVAKALAAKTAPDAAAQAAEATRAAAAAKVRSMSSSIFGASSGTSGAPVVSPAVAAAKQVVPDNASPTEIIQAWKEAQLAAGKDPNEAFLDQHRASATR